MNHPIYNLDNLPDPDKDPAFFNALENPEMKHVVNFLIINEIRRLDPVTMDDNQCRTQLAKLKGWQELIDFPEALKGYNQEKPLRENLP